LTWEKLNAETLLRPWDSGTGGKPRGFLPAQGHSGFEIISKWEGNKERDSESYRPKKKKEKKNPTLSEKKGHDEGKRKKEGFTAQRG